MYRLHLYMSCQKTESLLMCWNLLCWLLFYPLIWIGAMQLDKNDVKTKYMRLLIELSLYSGLIIVHTYQYFLDHSVPQKKQSISCNYTWYHKNFTIKLVLYLILAIMYNQPAGTHFSSFQQMTHICFLIQSEFLELSPTLDFTNWLILIKFVL